MTTSCSQSQVSFQKINKLQKKQLRLETCLETELLVQLTFAFLLHIHFGTCCKPARKVNWSNGREGKTIVSFKIRRYQCFNLYFEKAEVCDFTTSDLSWLSLKYVQMAREGSNKNQMTRAT